MLKSFLNKFQQVVAEKPVLPIQNKPDTLTVKKMNELLEKHLPAPTVAYCIDLWQKQPFSFKISRTRSSCFGNYIFRDGQHKITINHDLNAYAFLVTYIHEIAHQRAWLNKGRKRIEPHGKEWKKSFQDLMLPILNEDFLPTNLLLPLSAYMQNPAASSVSFAPLAEALRSFDAGEQVGISLAEVIDNEWFEFRGTVFQKIEKRRTRVLCLEKKSKRRYTILASGRFVW
ncbi:MAG: SprT-like domain-containing protein [Emticicia sp.]|nr:SprT-like domain-containing protein [Emticicia sp.]